MDQSYCFCTNLSVWLSPVYKQFNKEKKKRESLKQNFTGTVPRDFRNLFCFMTDTPSTLDYIFFYKLYTVLIWTGWFERRMFLRCYLTSHHTLSLIVYIIKKIYIYTLNLACISGLTRFGSGSSKGCRLSTDYQIRYFNNISINVLNE